MKVARFNYTHAADLYIDGKYVEADEYWPTDEQGDLDEEDIPALLTYLRAQGVTHVIDEEVFEDNEDDDGEWNPKPHPIDEWAKAHDLEP